jgi:hypothetical protein|tara:strand:+ start:2307 stop:2909 length:603 start_codon:yes stop_codon:yes gene_type:complete
MYLGNIVTATKIEDPHFKVCRKVETIQKGLPTLIVGWDKTKELYGDEVSILHKEISPTTCWTFSPKERKVEYEKDVTNFIYKCYNKIGDGIPYIYVDLIHDSRKKIKKIIRKIYSFERPIIYVHEDRMVYLYAEGMIFGIDLEIVSYLGIDPDKVVTKLCNLSGCLLVGTEIFNKYNDVMTKINNKVKFLPYLFDIESDG